MTLVVEPMTFINEDAGPLPDGGSLVYTWNVAKFATGQLFGTVISDQAGTLTVFLESEFGGSQNPLVVTQDTVVSPPNFAYTFLIRPVLPNARLVWINTGGSASTFTRISMQGILS